MEGLWGREGRKGQYLPFRQAPCKDFSRVRNSAVIGPFTAMISIAITPAAYEAVRMSFLDLDDNAAARPGPDGLVRIWLDRKFVDRLGLMRGPGQSHSDVILRLAEASS